MGWSSGGCYFSGAADQLIKHRKMGNVNDAAITDVLSALIYDLQQGDWDTEGESLGDYQEHPAIVEAFKLNGVYDECNNRYCPELQSYHHYCRRIRGHEGIHSTHKDHGKNRWARHPAVTWNQGQGEDDEDD